MGLAMNEIQNLKAIDRNVRIDPNIGSVKHRGNSCGDMPANTVMETLVGPSRILNCTATFVPIRRSIESQSYIQSRRSGFLNSSAEFFIIP